MPSKKKTNIKSLKANVQRTFATTSIAKKVEIEPEPIEEESASVEQSPISQETAAVDEEDFEQSLLLQLAERVKNVAQKDISRVTKMYDYERRLSKGLPRFVWTNTKTLESVLQSALDREEQCPRPITTNNELEEKLLVKAAVIYGILSHLGFSPERITQVLLKISQLDLEEALDWLVLHCPSSELQFESASISNSASSSDLPGLVDATTADKFDSPKSSKVSSSKVDPKVKFTASELETIRENPTTAYSQAKIDLKLLQLDKRKHLDAGQSAASLHSQSLKLKAVVEQAAKEYLFDKRDAELAFKNWKIAHDKGVVSDGTANTDTAADHDAQPSSSDQLEDLNTYEDNTEKAQTELDTAESAIIDPTPEVDHSPEAVEDENGGIFGQIFEEPPSEITTEQGSTIVIREMVMPKSFSGKTPRSLLEELCRRRDKFSRVSFHITRPAPACQAAVVIRWEGGSIQSFQMAVDACRDQIQAYNYVSTVALFSLDNASVHRQLPPVFRTLWTELETLQKKKDDVALCDHLRELQSILEQRGQLARPVVRQVDRQINGNATHKPARNHGFARSKPDDDPASIRLAFMERQARPAYLEMLEYRATLPIAAYRGQLMQTMQTAQVMICVADTGAGKSTQLPSFILEEYLRQGLPVRIYCTEPRRISAISLANRVSRELGEPADRCGTGDSLVGYSIRLEAKVSASTRLVFATTGVVLRMLENDSNLTDITHLILDEVHERSIESDFLLIIVKDLLKKRPELRVILMSATIDAERLSKYMSDAPIVTVPGRTYPVAPYFLEDAIELTGYQLSEDTESPYVAYRRHANHKAASTGLELADFDEEDSAKGSTALVGAYSRRTKVTLDLLDQSQINYDLLIVLLEKVCCYDHRFTQDYQGAVLIFLPSLESIKRLMEQLEAHPIFGSASFQLYPLHSSISSENQAQVFRVPPQDIRKIVVASNIAETGITIPDATVVIDSGKHREMRFDEKRQISRLVETYIAKSNALQRRGRAGRVQAGACFHLFTKQRFEEQMAESAQPEMLRLSLQDLALRIKIMPLFEGSIESVLLRGLDPPLPTNIQRAIASLQEVKALTASEDITSLGQHLAKLPLDVHLGKFLILACLFRCLDPALTIAATLSAKSPFVTPFGREMEADAAKRGFKVENSDFLTFHKAYASWRTACKDGSHFTFTRKHFLSHINLTQIEELRQQFYNFLVDCGFLPHARMFEPSKSRVRFLQSSPTHNQNSQDSQLIMSLVACAMHPKLLVMDSAGQFRTLSNNAPAAIHPTSVNFTPGRRPDFGRARYCAYFNIMSTKRLYVWESGAVDDLAVLLLCGEADVKLGTGSFSIDRKIRLGLPEKTAFAIKCLRQQFVHVFDQAMRHPAKALTDQQAEDWKTIEEVLSSEKQEHEEAVQPKNIIRF